MKTQYLLTLLAAIALLLPSCSGQKTPPDMPKLYPTSILITQEGAPCADANVQLVKKDDLNYKWLAGGRTNAEGVCVVKTNGKYDGAPEGDFQVVVYKTTRTESETRKNVPQPQDPAEAQAWSAKVAEEEKEYEEIDPKYKKYDQTDLTITVASGKNEVTFEVGPKVQIENKQMLTK